MTGVLFIINVPQKEYEVSLHKNDQCILQSKVLQKSKDDIHISMPKADTLDSGMYRSKSEITLNKVGNDYIKSSWDEIRQVLKSKRNKLKITRPVRGVDVLAAFHWDTPLENVSAEIFWDETKFKIEEVHSPKFTNTILFDYNVAYSFPVILIPNTLARLF